MRKFQLLSADFFSNALYRILLILSMSVNEEAPHSENVLITCRRQRDDQKD